MSVMLGPNEDLASAIIFSLAEGFAVVLTLFRLVFRLKIQRFWWEDAWAAVALVCTAMFIASTPAFFRHYDYDFIIIVDWINACMFTSIVWSVRISLVCSILRIANSLLMCRLSLLAAVCSILFCAATFGLEIWWCGRTRAALVSEQLRSSCFLPNSIVIFELATNCFADFLTLLLTLKLLWRVQLPPRQRRMIFSLFTASRFLCIFALPHSISQLVAKRDVQNLLANIEVTVFLIVCNLIVVVTYVYRFFRRSPDPGFVDDDDFTTGPHRSADSLTTVDLDIAQSDTRSNTEVASSWLHSSVPSTQ